MMLQSSAYYYYSRTTSRTSSRLLTSSASNSFRRRCATQQQQQIDPQQPSRQSFSSSSSTTRRRRPIYVSATRQHVGKTSVCLALVSGLAKRFDNRVGFIKPVGQQSVQVQAENNSNTTTTISVDKDAALIKQHFRLDHIDYQDTSPVLIPPGYTKDYIDGKITLQTQHEQICQAFERIDSKSDIVLAEGTGHCGVGSICETSNAQVARLLNARMVLVANGGLGNAFDELTLNHNLCQTHGVDIAGVIINKVKIDKFEQTKYYMTKLLKERWNVPLLGLMPDRQFLGSPALADMERLLPGSSLVSGMEHHLRHYTVKDLNLVATSLSVFLNNLRKNPDRTLYVCHASRNDILLGFLMESQQQASKGRHWETAMVVTGCENHPISTQVLEIVTSMPHAPPVLMAPQPTNTVMEAIYNFTPKLNMVDGHRVKTTVDHYEPCIDFDLLLERVGFVGDEDDDEEERRGEEILAEPSVTV
jgi:dethiobiotin synthetase